MLHKPTISVLIPCHNEEKSIRACVRSCLNQTRLPDEIVVVNDGSTDRSGAILAEFGSAIKVVTIPTATGNKSYAQEYGLRFITSEIFIATDGDTIMDSRFIEHIEKDFNNPQITAIAGYVKSLKYNWLTACRELDYVLGQDFHKVAQDKLGYLFVISGCAGAFRTEIFKRHIPFEHDTLTEDLDFTYRLHLQGFHIKLNRRAITYTQDPTTLGAYVNQMRRWYGGGWQNLLKHYRVLQHPFAAFELSLMYAEGIFLSSLFLVLPFINIRYFLLYSLSFIGLQLLVGIYGGITRRRFDLILYSPLFLVLNTLNAYIFLERFFVEIILGKKNLVWFKPPRQEIAT